MGDDCWEISEYAETLLVYNDLCKKVHYPQNKIVEMTDLSPRLLSLQYGSVGENNMSDI